MMKMRIGRGVRSNTASFLGTVFLRLVLVMLLMVGASQFAHAQEKQPIAHSLELLLGDGDLSSEDRKGVAKGFEDMCSKLSRKIPTLSPREEDWINSEIEAGRLEAIMNTVEFAKRQSQQTLIACLARSRALIAGRLEGQGEMFAWVLLLSSILDYTLEDHIKTLKRSGTIAISDDEVSFVALFPVMAKWMVDKILLPQSLGPGTPATSQ